ncbi:hypothetical protein THIOM_003852, partial [Candidatus Thiomargarita nelsonii]
MREGLVAKLKKKGQRLIAEDARAPLREVLEKLETVVISPLAENDVGVVPGEDQPIIYAEARGEI